MAQNPFRHVMSNPFSSITFHAACNEAVDASMRPIRQRVIRRLAEQVRCDRAEELIWSLSNEPAVESSHRFSELQELFGTEWNQANNVTPPPPAPHVEARFVQLIGKNPQWRALVLESVVQERRWSDILTGGFQFPLDRLSSFFEKLMSPQHPVARGTTSALASVGTALLAIWLPAAWNPDVYDKILHPVLKPFQNTTEVSSDFTRVMRSDAILHVRAVVDDNDLTAVVKPKVQPAILSVTLNPNIEPTSLRITPQIQYSSDNPGDFKTPTAKQSGVQVNFIPEANLSLLWKSVSNPDSPINVSVRELAPQPEPDSKLSRPDKAGSPDPKETLPTANPIRPVDRISDHLLALNQTRTSVIEATPNSIHSVVLQWFGGPKEPESCTLKFKVTKVNADGVHLSEIVQSCSPETSSLGTLQREEVVSPDKPRNFGQWILSVDETHRRWIFLHTATLRFTWQPAFKSPAPSAPTTATTH